MSKFIRVHDDETNTPVMVNLRHVLCFYAALGKTCIETDMAGHEPIWVNESYEEVERMIGSAQGGIPMERTEQY